MTGTMLISRSRSSKQPSTQPLTLSKTCFQSSYQIAIGIFNRYGGLFPPEVLLKTGHNLVRYQEHLIVPSRILQNYTKLSENLDLRTRVHYWMRAANRFLFTSPKRRCSMSHIRVYEVLCPYRWVFTS